MIVTPADQPRIVEMILDAHPEKRRLIFVHIPKCAGTDLTTNLGARYPVIHQTLAVPNWTAPDLLQSAVVDIERQLRNADTVFVGGHNRLQWVIANDLYRPGKDRLFTVIREPTEIVLSALNYTVGKLIADPFGLEPDTRGWLRNMGVADVSGWSVHDVALLALPSSAIPHNALCHFLGQDTLPTALDMIEASSIEISETSRYSKWAETAWGFSFTTRHNASRSIMALSDLPQSLVSNLCAEDIGLYAELTKRLGDNLSVKLGSLQQAPGRSDNATPQLESQPASQVQQVSNKSTIDQTMLADNLGMSSELAAALGALPPLSRKSRMASAVLCKICNSPAPFFDAVDFLKCTNGYPFGSSGVLVPYYRCDVCKFLFTGFFDAWTTIAFRRFVYNDDYIVIDPEYNGVRPVRVAERFAKLLAPARGSRILDWGSGSGVFASKLAESGFAAESYDPLTSPKEPVGKFGIITCIETIEHVPDPMQGFREMIACLTDDGIIMVGETLQPEDMERIRCSWWYIAPRNGHCSTFDRRTMAAIAERLGLVFRHHGPAGPHVLYRHERNICSEIAEQLGSAIAHFRLGAPGAGGDGWHGVEYSEGQPPFQWSASPELTWNIVVPSGPKRTVIVDLPIAHTVAPDFVSKCELQIGDSVAPINVHDRTIVAEVAGAVPGPTRVTLRTPPLVAARGPDKRELGIALRVCRT
jgi:hypothetical protein